MEDFIAGHNRIYASTLIQESTLTVGLVIFLLALTVILTITTSLGNSLILIALHKVSSLQLPS